MAAVPGSIQKELNEGVLSYSAIPYLLAAAAETTRKSLSVMPHRDRSSDRPGRLG